jgi:hypothetical protein
MKRFATGNTLNVACDETLHRERMACTCALAKLACGPVRGGLIMRAPLLRLAIGVPIALLASIALLIYLLVQWRRPRPHERRPVALQELAGMQRTISSRETLHLPNDSLG